MVYPDLQILSDRACGRLEMIPMGWYFQNMAETANPNRKGEK